MYLYILYNETLDKFYIGITKNPARRLKEHNSDQSHYTGRAKGFWKICYLKHYNSATEALKEERRLKRAKNKKYLLWYIKNSTGL